MAAAQPKHRPQLIAPCWPSPAGQGNRGFIDRPSPEPLAVRWRVAFTDQTTSPVVSGDGAVFVGGFDKHLYAFSPEGDKLFKDKLIGPVMTELAISAAGLVFVAPHHRPPTGLETRLLAIDPSAPKGRVRWEVSLGGVRRPLLAGDQGGVIALSSRGVLHAYDEAGRERFALTVGEPDWESGATSLIDGTIVTWSCADGQWWVTGVSPDGEVRFRSPTPRMLANPTALLDGGFWVVTLEAELLRFDARGVQIARQPGTSACLQRSSVSALPDGQLRLASDRRDQGQLKALSADGELRWTLDRPDGLSASPLVFADGGTLSWGLDGALIWVDAQGRVAWSVAVGSAALESYTQRSYVAPCPQGGVVLRVDAPMSPQAVRQRCELVALG